MSTYPDVVLEDGPVAYWMLDEPSGASTVIDSSGNGYTGSGISGITLHSYGTYPIVGSPQKSPTFSGGGLSIPGTVFTSLPFTLEIWSISSNPGWTWMLGSDTGGGNDWWGIANDNTVDYSNNAGNDAHGSGPSIPGAWHYMVTTIDGSGDLNHYVDNSLVHSAGSFAGTPSAGGRVLGNRGNGSEAWVGSMCHFAVYNKVLSTIRMTVHYVEATRRGAVSLA